ncbi:hypothetical protein [Phaeodactylibacter sp.]|uniref:hypothetical protein n=1 Tax=Phaeodactylibacter sp. TaxID=1940289 RepID=UPI0025FF359D|nr:hypothetical protein [Phaeodactylibacter sp.]MCI4649015.1 hypothetical protein [Phaeodactylibacter sp.]MCI5090773.1 hypothetical protein [Phaeodactylibacter sp.]
MSRSSRFFAAQSAKRCNAGGRAGSSWRWLLGGMALGRAVPYGWSSGLGLAGRWLVRKSSIFFSWMNLPLLKLRQAEETKIPGYTGTYRS